MKREEEDFTFANKLLLKSKQLIIFMNNINKVLIINLIYKAYNQVSFTHFKQFKTIKILS